MKQTFTEWLCETVPESATYLDVANLCLSLYCTVEFLPEELRSAAYTRDYLAESFAGLTRHRYGPESGVLFSSCYGASFHRPTDIGHWHEVMASVCRLGREPDIVGAARLVRSGGRHSGLR